MKAKLITLFLCVLLGACGSPQTEQNMAAQDVPVRNDSRIKMVRISVVEDNLAYYNKRGIYIITDTQTGQQFIGISGIGITELGAHGKYSYPDER